MESIEKDESHKIIEYAVKKIEEGTSHDEIKKQLRAVGWSEDEADSAYAAGLANCGVPLPDKNAQKIFSKKSSTVEIVVNFFSFILLGIFAVSLGVLLFGVINYFFQDKLVNYYKRSSADSIHYAIASLIIGVPLYYFAMRFWFRRLGEDKLKVESKLTKWITYLVLLVAAVTVVGDLIVVIFNMLQGEITTRFFLKALTIFMITGGIFSFYFLERKKVQYKKDISRRVFVLFGWVTLGIVIISIILGFMASGSPKTERMRSFDDARSRDLQSLANCISSYANKNKALPESLEGLKVDSDYSYCNNKKDPETKDIYEYVILNKTYESNGVIKGDFELCAYFSLELHDNGSSDDRFESYNMSKWFEHGTGRSCDKETVIIEKKSLN